MQLPGMPIQRSSQLKCPPTEQRQALASPKTDCSVCEVGSRNGPAAQARNAVVMFVAFCCTSMAEEQECFTGTIPCRQEVLRPCGWLS